MSDSVVSCLTPPGAGAIAVLAVRGPLAWPTVRELFRPASKQPLPDSPPDAGMVWFGHFGGDGLADEVVVAVKQTAPQPCLEIHCHGGPQVVDWLCELLVKRGLQLCPAAEFVAHAETPSRTAAFGMLAHAPTVRTASILLDQADGAMDRALAQIRDSLQRNDDAAAITQIDAILRYAGVGCHLVEPWRVAVAGAANVGKSSLVNALAGYQRSVVADVPGTTRDVVSVRLAFDGWPVEISDTAGLRDDATGLERDGVILARSALAGVDLILWVVDATSDPVWPDAAIAARNPLMIVNKIDAMPIWDISTVVGAIPVSAKMGTAIAALIGAIARRLVPAPPRPGEAVPFVLSSVERLRRLREMAAGRTRAEDLAGLAQW